MMRSASKVGIVTLVGLVLAGGSVAAQIDEPVGTPPPNTIKGLMTAVVSDILLDPAIGRAIEAAAEEAHLTIGGTARRFRSDQLADARRTSNAARNLADMGYGIVVISGGDPLADAGSAGIAAETTFLEIGQPRPCLTADGRPDPSRTCAGGPESLPFNFAAVDLADDEGAYLAGLVAALASRSGRLGIIVGADDCVDCQRVAEAFTLGARSVRPSISIQQAVLAEDGTTSVMGDPSTARIFAEAFINVYQPDVILPAAGASSTGIIEAACAAGIFAVGLHVDMAASYPNLADCILASVVNDYARVVRDAMFAVADDSLVRERTYGIRGDGVRVTEEWRRVPGLPVDLPARYDDARAAVEAGLVDTCPTWCPTRPRREAPSPSPSPEASTTG